MRGLFHIRAFLLAGCLLFWMTGCGENPGTDFVSPQMGAADERYETVSGYYYEHFNSQQRAVYEAFLRASGDPFGGEIQDLQTETGETVIMSLREINVVYQGFLYDHPEIFWLGNSFRYRRQPDENGDFSDALIDGILAVPIPDSEEALRAQQEALSETAEEILQTLPQDASGEALARAVHDWLTENVSYEEEASYDTALQSAHTAYGAVVERQAVCDGYALAYSYLLRQVGIESVPVPGQVAGMPHVWNLVRWDDAFHEVDVTWDALQEMESRWIYFDLTTQQMNEDHVREEEGIAALAPVTGS